MSDQDHNEQNALLREWRVAQITLLVGVVAAVAVGGYFVWQSMSKPSDAPAAMVDQELPPDATQQAPVVSESDIQANVEVCKAALKHATDFGIVRVDAKLAADLPQGTDVTGRYACVAATEAAKYLIAFDLTCRDLKKDECVNLFSITQDGGAVLYQRAQ